MIHTAKVFGIVNKAEVDVFLELSCFFDDPLDAVDLISGSSAFPQTSLNIWKFTVHVLLKSGLENFEHYFTSVWDECNCVVVWAFFDIALLYYYIIPVSGDTENQVRPVIKDRKAITFPVVKYGYDSWTIKKDEWQRTDLFKLWC